LGADPTRGVELAEDGARCGVFSPRSCSAARRRAGEGDAVGRLGVPSFLALLIGLLTPSAVDGDAGAPVRGDRRTSECTIAVAPDSRGRNDNFVLRRAKVCTPF